MKTNSAQSRGFTLVELLVVIAIIATLAGIATPMILSAQKSGARTEAVSNAKQIGLALIQFDTDFGSFPDSDTGERVKDITGSDLTFGTTNSNDYFKQLIATGVQSEEIFYAKMDGTTKPDNVYNTDADALAEGEVGFGYVMIQGDDGDEGQSTSGNAGRPVVCAPLLAGGSGWEFDSDPYSGKAVILRLDNSVTTPQINSEDEVVVSQSGGTSITIEQTGDNTVWRNRQPVLMRPDGI